MPSTAGGCGVSPFAFGLKRVKRHMVPDVSGARASVTITRSIRWSRSAERDIMALMVATSGDCNHDLTNNFMHASSWIVARKFASSLRQPFQQDL